MSSPVTLAVDLDILLSCYPATDQPVALPCPEPSFAFRVRRPPLETAPALSSNSPRNAACLPPSDVSPNQSPSSGASHGTAADSATGAVAGHTQVQLAWLRPGVRRFLLAIQPHVNAVLVVRRYCHGGRRCCTNGRNTNCPSSGYPCASSLGGGSDGGGCRGGKWEEEVGGCTGALLSVALPNIDPEGQFFGQRIVLVQDRLSSRSSRPREASATSSSQNVAEDAAAAMPWMDTALDGAAVAATAGGFSSRALHDLGALSTPMPDGSPGLIVATTADRALFGPLAEHVIECQPYKKEYGKYDDVLDCLASVVAEPLLGVSVPRALRQLGLGHGKLQPSPMMQAIHAQTVLRLAQRLQGGGGPQGQGGGAVVAAAVGPPAATAAFGGQQNVGAGLEQLHPQPQQQKQPHQGRECDRPFKTLQQCISRPRAGAMSGGTADLEGRPPGQAQQWPGVSAQPQAPPPPPPPQQGLKRQPSRKVSQRGPSANHRQRKGAASSDSDSSRSGGRKNRPQSTVPPQPLPSIPEVPFQELGEPAPEPVPEVDSAMGPPVPPSVVADAVLAPSPLPPSQPQHQSPASRAAVPRVSPSAGSVGGPRRTAWDSEPLPYGLVTTVSPTAATAMLQRLAVLSGGGSSDGGVPREPWLSSSGGELIRRPKSFPAAAKPHVTRHISGCKVGFGRTETEARRGAIAVVEESVRPSSPLTSAASAMAAATTRLISRIIGGHRQRRCRPSGAPTNGNAATATSRQGSCDLVGAEAPVRQEAAVHPASPAGRSMALAAQSCAVLIVPAAATGALSPRQPSVNACSTPAVPLLPVDAYGNGAAVGQRPHALRQPSCRASMPGAVVWVEQPESISGACDETRPPAVKPSGRGSCDAGEIPAGGEPITPSRARARVSAPSGLSYTASEDPSTNEEGRRHMHLHDGHAMPGSVRQSADAQHADVREQHSSPVAISGRSGGASLAAQAGAPPATSTAVDAAERTSCASGAMGAGGVRADAVGVNVRFHTASAVER